MWNNVITKVFWRVILVMVYVVVFRKMVSFLARSNFLVLLDSFKYELVGV